MHFTRCLVRPVALGVLACALSAPTLAASTDTPSSSDAGAPAATRSRLVELGDALGSPGKVQLLGVPPGEAAHSYAIGHLQLHFGQGAVFQVVAAGIPIGIFFHGDGSFSYSTDDVFERELFRLDVDRVTHLKVEDRTLSGHLGTALVLDSRLATATKPSGDAQRPSEDVQKALADHLERFAHDRLATDTLVAQAVVEQPQTPVAVVRMEAGRDDLVYVHDGLRQGAEMLRAMKRFPTYAALSGSRYPQSLSHQPLGKALERWPVPYTLADVDLELVNPEERAMTLAVRETFDVEQPIETLALSLWNQRVTGDGLFPYHLESVTTADGKVLPSVHRNDDLVVQLPGPAHPGDRVELRFRISGDVLNHPDGHSFWWLPIGNWLPIPPRWDMTHFTYHAVVKSAAPFIPFSMGHEVRRWEEDGLSCVETRLDKPVQFAVVLAGKYHTYSEERDGFRITLASYAFSHDESMRRIANNMFEMKKLYEVLLGKFPFDELHIVEINEYGFGIAPPGVIYLTREAFDPSPQGRRFREELNHRMAHELAHMYWGHIAQMSSPEEQWLSESTAEYYGAVAVGKFLGERKLKAAYRNWREQESLIDDAPSVYLANRIAGEKAGRERYCLLYAHGPLMLHELRQELGDQAFFTVMKSFLTNFRFEPVKTEKFIELTNFITKKDYRPWFEEHLFGLD